MNKLFVPILLGTGRVGRFSDRVANYVLSKIKEHDLESELIDVRDYVSPVTIRPEDMNEKGKEWSKIIKRSDGLIIVTPEYNRSYPGELKIFLDQLYQEYSEVPAAVCCVSSGYFGGSRVFEHLLPVLHRLGFIVLKNPIYFSNVEKLFDEQGKILDSTYHNKVSKMIDELSLLILKLRHEDNFNPS